MDSPPKQDRSLRPTQLSVATLLQLVAIASVWAVIFANSYFRQIIATLVILATVLSILSHLAYRYVLPHRLTPLVASHLLCLAWFVLYGGVLWSSEAFPAKLYPILLIASGPFARGINSWSDLFSPVALTVFTASAIGLCFRPNPLATHLLSLAAALWQTSGFVLAVFASLGT